jgi:hypothetical protein
MTLQGYMRRFSLHGQPGPAILVSNAGYSKPISGIVHIPTEEFDLFLVPYMAS